MVQVLVNLLGISVLLQKSAQHSQAAHPEHLGGQASFPGTLSLSCSMQVIGTRAPELLKLRSSLACKLALAGVRAGVTSY